MKRINLKLLVILVGCFIGFSVSTYFFHEWQVSRKARILVTRAAEARAESKIREAARLLGRYLRHVPDDLEQRMQWSQDLDVVCELPDVELERKKRDIRRALSVYEDALRQDTEDKFLPVRRKFVKFATRYGIDLTAIDHLNHLIASEENQNKPDYELILELAILEAKNGKNQEAVSRFKELVGYDEITGTFDEEKATAAQNIKAYVILAYVYMDHLLAEDHADRIMEQMIKVNQDNYEAHLENGGWLIRRAGTSDEMQERGRQEVLQALKMAPDNPKVIFNAAGIYVSGENFSEAAALLQKCLESDRDIPSLLENSMYRLLAHAHGNQGKTDEMLAWLDKGLKKSPENTALLWLAGNIYLDLKRYEDVRQIIKRLDGLKYAPHQLDFLKGRIDFKQGKWLAAARRMENTQSLLLDQQPLYLRINQDLGRCYEILGKADRQLEAAGRVLTIQPDDLTARRLKATALRRLRRIDQAYEEFLAIENLLQERNLQPNPRFMETMLNLKKTIQMRRPEKERDWSEVDQALTEINAMKDFPQIRKIILRTDVMLRKGQVDQAEALVKGAIKEHPESINLWSVAADLISREKGPEQAFKLLDRMQERFKGSVSMRLILADHIVRRNSKDVKQELAQLEDNIDAFTPAQKAQLWSGLASSYRRIRDLQQSRRLIRLISDAHPDNLPIHETLFNLALETNDDAGMREALDEIGRLIGKNRAAWKFSEATRLVALARNKEADPLALDRARRLLKEARLERPDWYALSRLKAEIHLMDEDEESAIEMFQQSLDKGPAEPRIVRLLVDMLLKRNQLEEAQATLRRLDTSQWTDLERRQHSRILAALGKTDEAVKLAQQIAETSQYAEDHLWLAQVYSSTKRLAEAETSLRRAVELAPRRENARLSLVRLLLATGNRAEAEAEVRRIEISFPQHQVLLLLGQCYELLRDFPQTRRFYLMALKADPKNTKALRFVAGYYLMVNQENEAKKYIARLLKDARPNAQSIPADVAWARRAMAQLLAGTRSYPDYLEARRLLDANIRKGGKMSSEDLFVWASIAITRPNGLPRQTVIKKFEEIQNKQRPLSTREKLVLSRLYEKTGRWEDCRGIMQGLIANHKSNPRIITTWCQMLLINEDRKAQAADQVEKILKKVDQDLPSVKTIRAHMLAQQGKVPQAIELVQSMVPRPLSEDQVDQLRRSAELLEQLGLSVENEELFQAAEKMMRAYVKRRPERKLQLAALLGRRGRIEEAFDLCDQATQGRGILGVTQIGVGTLSMHKADLPPDSPHFQRVNAWFQTAFKRFPNSNSLRLNKAMLEDARGNYKEVIKYYKKYLASKGIDRRQRAVIQNNLAYVLAQRGETEESFKLVQQSIKQLGPYPDLLDTRAMVYLARGETLKAIINLGDALEAGENPMMHFHLALAHQQDNNTSAAMEAFEQAKQLGLDMNNLSPIERRKYKQLEKTLLLEKVDAVKIN